MVNYVGQPQSSLSDQASILAWRAVIVVTRALNRLVSWAAPIVLPLKPYWWIPVVAVLFGFVAGLGAVILLA
jgi:hypothetical protein